MPKPIPHRPFDERTMMSRVPLDPAEVEYYTRPNRWFDYALVATPFIGIGWIIVRSLW